MTASLEFQRVTRAFRRADAPAVNDITLDVQENEILALVGESGSGKTTLLRLAAGLERPDDGNILIGGTLSSNKDTFIPPEKRGVGMVFQDGALFPHLNAAKNITYGLTGQTREEKQKRVTFLLAMVGLGGMEARFPHQLSGGERQRLALARTLAPNPKIILFDEPFSNLDPSLRRNLRDEIRSILKKLNATAIFVTHDAEDALAVADRIAILKRGTLEQVGTPAEVYRSPKDGYCARLFGPANLFPRGEEAAAWIRPEQMKLRLEAGDETLPGRIERIHDSGRDREIHIKPDSAKDGDANWVYFDDSGKTLKVGMRVWLGVG